ncbi:MAG: hypothetical protein KDD82_20195 [Planctomycetes bacterium]|nr:hypothetical protein [Planctomycetota bacterium]
MPLLRFVLACSLIAAVGCGGGPEAAGEAPPEATETPTGDARLQVIVWSSTSRRAVAATGTVSGAGRSLELDTRAHSQDGQTFSNLAPGLYRVDVKTRYDEGEAHRVTGSEKVYLEPGADEDLTVVAIDHPGDN